MSPIPRATGKNGVLVTEVYKFGFLPRFDFVNEYYIAEKHPVEISIVRLAK